MHLDPHLCRPQGKATCEAPQLFSTSQIQHIPWLQGAKEQWTETHYPHTHSHTYLGTPGFRVKAAGRTGSFWEGQGEVACLAS